MGTKSWKDQLTTSVQSWEEGRRHILLGISLGSSLFSTGAGRSKTIYNQLLAGNISYSTLLVLLVVCKSTEISLFFPDFQVRYVRTSAANF